MNNLSNNYNNNLEYKQCEIGIMIEKKIILIKGQFK